MGMPPRLIEKKSSPVACSPAIRVGVSGLVPVLTGDVTNVMSVVPGGGGVGEVTA